MQNNIVFKLLQKEFNRLLVDLWPYSHVVIIEMQKILPFIVYFLLVCFIVWAMYQLIRLCLLWKESKTPIVFFDVAPPATTEQSSFTTTQLFTSVHGLLRQRSFFMRFFDIPKSYSFEIVSTKTKGIRYLLRVSEEDAPIIKKSIISYLPGIQVKETSDYLTLGSTVGHILEFRLTHHFAFPLKKQDNLKEYDPIAYITGTMTKLSDSELVGVQLVISPVTRHLEQEIARLRGLFLYHRDVVTEIKANSSSVTGIAQTGIFVLLQILLFPLGLAIWVLTGGHEGPLMPIAKWTSKVPESSYRDIVEAQIKQKVDQQLFAVSMRFLTVADSYKSRSTTERGFLSALAPFTNAGHQSLGRYWMWHVAKLQKVFHFFYKHRIQSPLTTMVLSTSELSDLYHFPYMSTTKTENIAKLHYAELPAPLSLKNGEKRDIYFAVNEYGGTQTPIGLTEEERRRHMYILGATGTGKSTMLLSMIQEDIKHGKGLSVIDPHGDLIEQILSIIPRDRILDAVYFNPDDISYPMGINLLERTQGLSPDEELREKEFIAESIISVFQKIYTDKYSGPRMEYILRNTIHTAFTIPDATLFTVYKLLINTEYRKSVVRNLTDENLKDFWKYEFAKAGDYQKVKMISPITNKIGRFLFSPTAKRILEQPRSTMSFDEIMNDGKILLCNLAKGKIGEDNSSVFGVLIMAKIQLAALKRARMKQEDRRDFYLYVDEFQNFATPAFAQILSEARKYRLNAILAHQTTSQIEENSLVHVTLANTGTVICFRTANPEDERLILPQFTPYISQGEIASLPSYHFYMRLGALTPEEPFSGVTIPVSIQPSNSKMNEIVESSRTHYAKRYTEVEVKPVQKKENTRANKVYSAVP